MSGNAARLNAISMIANHELPEPIGFEEIPSGDLFAINAFTFDKMKERLPKDAYKKLMRTVQHGEQFGPRTADAVATAMKTWAMERGATHFGHIFYPLTGYTAEKNDAFFDPDGMGGIVSEFTGAALMQQEPDGSSFPSGGIRQTHEARGYTQWDVTSPAYLIENQNGLTLTIPSAFVSWSGMATDKKTPLLRSMKALNTQAQRVLKALGNSEVGYVTATAGCEQEYFLVDRNFYLTRPDLLNAGRTLFGAASPKGQEFDDHYFGAINPRVAAFMLDFERELYKLGVPVKTRHNEVAPGQYEVAPVFENSNTAADHQQLVMTIIQRVAPKYGFACLIHEKPFAGINGSGKHLNVALGNSTQGNLLEPGDRPHENKQFLVFCGAFIRAVHKYAPLLRAGIASASNDHRLGANEAPPAIISVFLGDQINDVFQQILNDGEANSSTPIGEMNLGADILSSMLIHAGDRNRTSPFAFTGNKFEFRAVGSSQSVSGSITIINTILAESLDYFATQLEGAKDINKAINSVLAATMEDAHQIIFNGDGYSETWHAEAAARGLPNLRTTPEALPAYLDKSVEELFEKYGVLNKTELHAVYDVALEQYNMTINVEANLVLEMGKTMIYPAAVRYQSELATAAANLDAIGIEPDLELLQMLTSKIAGLKTALIALAEAHAFEAEDDAAHSFHNKDVVLPAMMAVREAADYLEGYVADDLWPLPTYQEMLFIR
ncbi:MAG: glutamine synthetase [Candidatus Promineifilaceae bacterium]|jgi:glutamine synthetase